MPTPNPRHLNFSIPGAYEIFMPGSAMASALRWHKLSTPWWLMVHSRDRLPSAAIISMPAPWPIPIS